LRPTSSADTVIIGASHAGVTLAATLRQKKYAGEITLIGGEPRLPYHRPPLSKAALADEERDVAGELRPEAFYAQNDIALLTGVNVVEVDRAARRVWLEDARSVDYRTLVFATGARPRRLHTPGAELDGVVTLRSASDAKTLRQHLVPGAKLVIVGAGYIGLEVAATARKLGVEVVVVEAGARVLNRVASDPVAAWVLARHQKAGVAFRLGQTVSRIQGNDGRVNSVALSSGETIGADLVLVGIGVDPVTDVAASAGLATDNGIVVDNACRTDAADIFAIGDCARFPCQWTGQDRRIESIQNAQDQARTVAAALSGNADTRYEALPWFWSDQYADKLQSAGISAPGDDLVIEGDPEAASFTVFHRRDGRIVASESINDPRGHMRSRQLIKEANMAS